MSALTLSPTLWGLAMLVALAVDRLWGEPPVRWHPVVWMGSALDWAGRWIAPVAKVAHRDAKGGRAGLWADKALPFGLGALAWCALAALVVAVAWGVQSVLLTGVQTGLTDAQQDGWATTARTALTALVLGALLKPLLALRMLCDEVRAVEAALGQSLAAGRERLGWLVSRDVAQLTEAEVRESAIETLAENFNDSVVAPLFWFALAGLPGAALYRLANTADAMWGYRGERGGRDWTWAGKWAARADDVLSWLPARLTALLLVAVAVVWQGQRRLNGLTGLRGQGVARWRLVRQLGRLPAQARRTPSPNSGWPMAAMALVLGIRLGKPGAYVLNAHGRVPQSADTVLALNLIKKMASALYCIGLLAIVFDNIYS
ncbi:MAG: cobalamin biosynthesis protein CobD [Polaromonas sp.]|nr:cobalamin biosynthesis protein CobD [Polaromonas sp.]